MILYMKCYNKQLGKEEHPSHSYKCFKIDLTWTKYEQFILHILFLNIDILPTQANLQVDTCGENPFCSYF